MSRIAVTMPQVPFIRGGAEAHCSGLVEALRREGHQAELVTLPFKWYPRDELLKQILLWRLVDLSESDGDPIDLVIGTKFPSYLVRHPNKVVWLIHQFRQIYDLFGTEYSDFTDSADDREVREAIRRADIEGLGDAKAVYTNAANTASRLRQFCDLEGQTLYHPPPLEPLLRGVEPGGDGDGVLSVGRLDPIKRVDLLLDAAARVPGLRVEVVGTGPAEDGLRRHAAALGIEDRCRFLGRLGDEGLAAAYRRCRAVWYAPYDEDFGYVTLEAFLAGRPVITAEDAGGPLEFVRHQETGLVASTDVESHAEALAQLVAEPETARRLGAAGRESVESITWEGAARTLLQAGGIG